MAISRRGFLGATAGSAVVMNARAVVQAARLGLAPQAQAQPQAPPTTGQGAAVQNLEPWVGQPQPYPYVTTRSTVALVKGENRRQLIHDALAAIDEQIRPVLKTKKYVVIKPNCVTQVALGTTSPDAIMGILDYLAPRYKGPIMICESSGNTRGNYEALGYPKMVDQVRKQNVTLVDLNEEAKYEVVTVFDYHAHVLPVRLAARLLDPSAYIICSSVMKTHNAQVATMSVKNMVMGAPLAAPPKVTPRWSDKRKFHVGVRMMQVNMMLTARKLRPFWGAAVVDGFEGMEGNGPHQGTPVPHRIAVASTDYLAADRVGVECMGIDPDSVGSLVYGYQDGLGQYDLEKIDVRGEKVADVRRVYRLHPDIEKEREWMQPMQELPSRLGMDLRGYVEADFS
jgi:uncharacterized protein (DUF362 family)